MKEITFTETQRVILENLLSKRVESTKSFEQENGKNNYYSKYDKAIESVRLKISQNSSNILTPNEKSSCISCINENYNILPEELSIPSPLNMLRNEISGFLSINEYDSARDILHKCGYFKQKHLGRYTNDFIRYNDYLNAMEKAKKSDIILLSRQGESNYYKIAFVFEGKEYLPFELRHAIHWKDFEFISLKGKSVNELGSVSFSLISNKKEALEKLSPLKTNYPVVTFSILELLLNQG